MADRNSARKSELKNGKLISMGVVFTLILIMLIGRVVFIKIVHGETYERRAVDQEANRKSIETVLTARRGSIFDRNRQPLAISYAVDNVILDISEMVKESQRSKKGKETVEKTVANLSKYLGIPVETINGYLATDENGTPLKDVRYFILEREVDRKITQALMSSGVKCVYAEEVSKRTYVNGKMAPSVLGFLRGDTSLGLERQYDKELSGVNGKMYRVYDNDDSGQGGKEDAVDGYSLVTTIDSFLQQAAEEAVKNSNAQFEARTTAILIMNPNTGEVLAMAQYPPFDNNAPTDINNIGDAGDMRFRTELEALSAEEQMNRLNQIWTNFNISNSFEPGSIYKPFVVAAGLEENVITPESSYFCSGYKIVNGRKKPINCHLTTGHGTQTLTQVLANSCNVAMMDIVEEMGADIYFQYHNNFGFGEYTDIDLPGEGAFASQQYPLSELKYPVQLATSSFGQGFNVTAIQELRAFSALINGGKLMRPYVVAQIVDGNGNVVKDNAPVVQRKVISEDTSAYLRKAMQSVMTPTGTGWKVDINGYAIGGKTGTAQQGERHEDINLDEFTLSFVSYLPADNPDIITLVVIDRPIDYVDGVTTPAYMMRELLLNIIKYKGYLPSGEADEADDVHAGSDSFELADLVSQDTADATHYLNNAGLDYEIIGSGDTVTKQMPNAGARVSKGAKIYLYITSGENDGDQLQLALVPKLIGLTAQQAVELLANVGLNPVIYGDEPSGQADVGEAKTANEDFDAPVEMDAVEAEDVSWQVVREQMPSADIYVQPGTEIKLKVRAAE